MKERKVPYRTCSVTLEKLEKKDLLRVVRNKEGDVFVDLTGKKNGRGAYIKKDLEVLKEAKKRKSLERKLECTIPDSIYEEIEKIIEN